MPERLNGLLESLYRLQWHGVKLGLENMRLLADALDRPQDDLKFVHVAGTNGKGTCCAVLESIYRAAGYRTGLYTSPHLVSFHERFCLSGRPVDDCALEVGLSRIQEAVSDLSRRGTRVTFFEAATGLALYLFREADVEIVLWETGLGGRLDATNIVRPEAAVVTGIAMDHQEYLGETLVEIAGEKAGIIKDGVPVLSHDHSDHPDVNAVIQATAREREAPLHFVQPPDLIEFDSRRWMTRFAGWELPVMGRPAAVNAHLAITTTRVLQERGWRAGEDAIRAGMESVQWPARFQRLRADPPLILDGAHNRQALSSVLVTWDALYGGAPGHLIFGCLKDKQIDRGGRLFSGIPQVTLVPVDSPRSRNPETLKELFPAAEECRVRSVDEALEGEWRQPSSGGCLVCGSLFLAGEVLSLSARKGWLER